MSMAQAMHIALSLREFDGEVGRVNLEDCLLETMTGCCTFVVSAACACLKFGWWLGSLLGPLNVMLQTKEEHPETGRVNHATYLFLQTMDVRDSLLSVPRRQPAARLV
jgi:hypothetical protein